MAVITDIDPDVSAIARIDAVPRILDVVCRATGMGFAAVARVTEDRWIACAVRDEIAFGLEPGGELKVETTICDEVRDSAELVVIDHVEEDEIYCRHPTPAMYGFQSYISVPIFRPSGAFFGTLCAIDPRPARLNTPETVGMFRLFAELIGLHLDLQERLWASETALRDERQDAELREQFIAVLGHDLRNPLAAIDAGTKLLLKQPLDDNGKSILHMMQKGADRMAGLIDDVLDFARARLGGGLSLSRDPANALDPALQQVVEEMRTVSPGHTIESEIAVSQAVDCDRARIAQLLSNLLGNALTHGAADRPVVVRALTGDGRFELSVINGGEPIPPEKIERLFQPFFRGDSHEGLGLGLYIAAEIARAHGGTLEVSSTAAETRFTFCMPLG